MQTDKDRKLTQLEQANKSKCFQNEPIELEPDSNIQMQNHVQEDSQMQPEQSNQQQAQYDPQYEDYQQYDYDYDNVGSYFDPQHYHNLDRKKMSQSKNSQYEMQDLIKLIQKDIEEVTKLTGFSRSWALIYYQACGWKPNNVSTFVDEKGTCRQMIHYIPSNQIQLVTVGECDICCLDNMRIFKNLCGHSFCSYCWKSHLLQRMKQFHTQPFPPCINGDCQVRTSPEICQFLSEEDSHFKKVYIRTLCRSYAIGNPKVKMCKGKQKISCDKCFKVNKLFEMLDCQNCGNLLCARCGDQYHVPSECYELLNWRKVVEESTNFVINLNYRICPNCKQAVQKSIGCNSLNCKCKHVFCYTCGQSWLPNHSQHGVCYRQKQIDALQKEQNKKLENQKQYTDKLEKFKAEVQNYVSKIKKLDLVDVEDIKRKLINDFQIISNQLDYLAVLKKKLQIALLRGKNSILTLYFDENLSIKTDLGNLTKLIEDSYTFLVYDLHDIIEAYSGEKIVGKRATQLRKSNIDFKELLSKQKVNMLSIMNKFGRYLVE